MGRPASFQCSGRDIAGCPVMLNGDVNGVNVVHRRAQLAEVAVGGEDTQPRRGLAELGRDQDVEARGRRRRLPTSGEPAGVVVRPLERGDVLRRR